jgi:hypothetical protein
MTMISIVVPPEARIAEGDAEWSLEAFMAQLPVMVSLTEAPSPISGTLGSGDIHAARIGEGGELHLTFDLYEALLPIQFPIGDDPFPGGIVYVPMGRGLRITRIWVGQRRGDDNRLVPWAPEPQALQIQCVLGASPPAYDCSWPERLLAAFKGGVAWTATGRGMEQALANLAHDHMDVIVTEVQLDDGTGLELAARIRAAYPDIGVVLLAEQIDDALVARARRRRAVWNRLSRGVSLSLTGQ